MTVPVTDERDDATLVTAHLAGDPSAFSDLYQRHRSRTFAVCLQTLRDREAALDVTQDVWVKLVTRLDRWDQRAAFTTWLHRVTVNSCYDYLRVRRPDPVADIPEEAATVPERDIALGMDIEHALYGLSEEHRTVVVLHDVEGLRYEDISETLEIPVGTVKSRLARARMRLAQSLSGPDTQSRGTRGQGGDPPG